MSEGAIIFALAICLLIGFPLCLFFWPRLMNKCPRCGSRLTYTKISTVPAPGLETQFLGIRQKQIEHLFCIKRHGQQQKPERQKFIKPLGIEPSGFLFWSLMKIVNIMDFYRNRFIKEDKILLSISVSRNTGSTVNSSRPSPVQNPILHRAFANQFFKLDSY